MNSEIENISGELNKRLAYPYKWGTKQTDVLDQQTKFIYKTPFFDDLLKIIDDRFIDTENFEQIKNYTLNRWYNFYSAMAVEAIFKTHSKVKPAKNSKDKEVDFFIDDIPFDHKTTVFPKGLKMNFNEAINQPGNVVKWLYDNQSSQGRFHLKNRLFVVLYAKDGKHWQLKAHLKKIERAVDQFLNNFKTSKLLQLKIDEDKACTYSDLIWVIA